MLSLVVWVASSCAYQDYSLSDGRIVSCKDVLYTSCGMYLGRCKDKREFECQTNVIKLNAEDRKAKVMEMNPEIELKPMIISPRTDNPCGQGI